MTVTLPFPPLAERFAAIVGRLVEGIEELLKIWPTRDPRAEPSLGLVRLTKTWPLERSEAMRDLIARFRRAGTLRPPKPRPPRTARPRHEDRWERSAWRRGSAGCGG